MNGIDRTVLRHVLAAALVVGIGATLVTGAAEPTGTASGTSTDSATTRVHGVELAFDARTGRLVPPPPEIVLQLRTALAETYAATRASSQVTPIVNGARSLVLDERQAAFSIARVEADGHVSTRCVAGAANAEAALTQSASGAPRGEE